ncbi:ATP-binding cassette domain-containing protein [Thalassobacillus sp. CUG 92003]|uniref:ATP-binding cassette domain-containing protein n=1 Tax=Thalassobacillus sp. CUG 92003 TaxID=2736641 RepID=UPI0015E785D1|nr:ABC transporter ATP-binding protein [Thalassobacillus sp. CUG 92003]
MMLDIDMHNVALHYGRFEALNDVTVHMESGKTYGVIGRNGAGKTTLLSLLASFMKPSSGSIRVGGEEPFEHAGIMSQVAFVYEVDYREEQEKVKAFIETAERYRPYFDTDYAHRLAKRFNLPFDKPVKKLSSGMQSALNVTIGLASRSPITIFDEAYLGMDAPTREIFYQEVLEEQASHPRTIILSTHLVSEMDYLFDQVVIIDKGRLVLHEPYDELLNRGAAITGGADVVDGFVHDMKKLNEQQLGGTKSVMIYGELSDAKRQEAREKGLEIGPVSLQDLFIHLTREGE